MKQIVQLPEDNTGEILVYLGFGDDFLDRIPKEHSMKEKTISQPSLILQISAPQKVLLGV